MSDDIAFRILSSTRTHRANDMSSSAQRETRRGNRLEAFARQHREEARDPMSMDLVGWNEDLAKQSPWPWCFKCKTVVRAYGVEERETRAPVVWAKCHGQQRAIRIEKPHRDIDKTDEGWLRRRMRNLVFFAD